MDNEIYARHAWRTVFITAIRGGLAPATMLSYPSWEQKVVQGLLKEHLDESKQLQDILKKQSRKSYVHYLILLTLILALISYRLIHTIQMIFVQISARIDITIPPVTLDHGPRNGTLIDGMLYSINKTAYGLSFFNANMFCWVTYLYVFFGVFLRKY